TDNNRRDGNPVVQGPDDPAPGYYISTTALQDTSKRVSDPRRYVNSAEIPYIALPPRFGHGVALGDVVVVLNESSASIAFAIFADIGPPDSIGEGSIALASLLGVNPSPKKGGTKSGIAYVLFPHSGSGRPMSSSEIHDVGSARFEKWGGQERLTACFPSR